MRHQAGASLPRILPGHAEGVEDGRLGPAAVNARLAEFEPFTIVCVQDEIATLNVHQAKLERERDQAIQEQLRREIEIQERGTPVPSASVVLFYCGVMGASFLTDTAVAKGMTPTLGEMGPVLPWVMGFALTAVPSFLMKAAISRKEPVETRLGEKVTPTIFLTLSIVLGIVIAWFRFAHLSSIEAVRYSGGAMEEIYRAHGAPILLLLVSLTLGFAAWTTHIWDRLDRYIFVHYRLCVIAHFRIRVRKIDKLLAQIEPTRIQREKRIEAVKESCEAEYRHGVALANAKGPSDISSLKAALASVATCGLSLTGSIAAYSLALKAGMDHVLALTLGLGIFAALAGGGLFFALPFLKRDTVSPRAVQLALPTALLLLALLVLTGCGAAAPLQPMHVGAMLDVTRSVKATDKELTGAMLTVLSRLPRCSALTIVPINARAGSMFEVKLPCERAQYDDDLRAVYKQLCSQLPAQLEHWRSTDLFSDYRNAFTLAAERLELSTNRTLIVLGDMTDDSGQKADKSPPPPDALALRPQSFRDTKVYIGFLESSSVDRLSGEEKKTFQENWRKAFIAAGTSEADITIRTFGLQGVEAWADTVIGPMNPAFEEFARQKGVGK